MDVSVLKEDFKKSNRNLIIETAMHCYDIKNEPFLDLWKFVLYILITYLKFYILKS